MLNVDSIANVVSTHFNEACAIFFSAVVILTFLGIGEGRGEGDKERVCA